MSTETQTMEPVSNAPTRDAKSARRYRVTVLTPTLAGDGQKLSPIDYMVWKDQVNVLNQRRIFRLLAGGPRIESYLGQLRKSEKLDFASWGGYAQNYATRRIALDDAAITDVYNRTPAENCFIPTFASTTGGFYLPATVLKGALRLALIEDRVNDGHIKAAVDGLNGDYPRRASVQFESAVIGASSMVRTRSAMFSDSRAVSKPVTRVYLVRVATLLDRGGKLEPAWKAVPRGSVAFNRANDSRALFAEMAEPGTVFEGDFRHPAAFANVEASRLLHGKGVLKNEEIVRAANHAARMLLDAHKHFAETAGLAQLVALCEALLKRVDEAQSAGRFLACVGWGTGLLAKTIWPAASAERLREGLRDVPGYGSALRTGLPFPKTRHLIVRQGRPVSMPGWIEVELY